MELSNNNPPGADTGTAGQEKIKTREIHHHHYRDKSSLNPGSLLLGSLILLAGLYLLARNLGLLPARFDLDLQDLWPLLIITVGLTLMAGRGWASALIGIAVALIVVLVAAAALFTSVSWQMLPGSVKRLGETGAAALFCERNGGSVEFHRAENNSRNGLCRFEDGSACELLELFHGGCQSGKNTTSKLIN